MRTNNTLEQRISEILTKWNPIDVPEFIAEDEYGTYVKPIIAIGKNSKGLNEYLKNLVGETLGLGYDENNVEHQQDIEKIVQELIQAFDSEGPLRA